MNYLKSSCGWIDASSAIDAVVLRRSYKVTASNEVTYLHLPVVTDAVTESWPILRCTRASWPTRGPLGRAHSAFLQGFASCHLLHTSAQYALEYLYVSVEPAATSPDCIQCSRCPDCKMVQLRFLCLPLDRGLFWSCCPLPSGR